MKPCLILLLELTLQKSWREGELLRYQAREGSSGRVDASERVKVVVVCR